MSIILSIISEHKRKYMTESINKKISYGNKIGKRISKWGALSNILPQAS